jgi:G3E family GTPase
MITFLAASGFLGAGKTTTLVATARHLQKAGHRVAVITNDQGTDLVDTQLVRADVELVAEVTGGCFCCRFGDLLAVAQELIDGQGVDTILAEAVGSCTDLQATVVRPLRTYYGDRFRAGRLATIVDPGRLAAFRTALPISDTESDLSYLFNKQLQEADVVAVNKIDLLTEDALATVSGALRRTCPGAIVLGYSAASGRGLENLVRQWLAESPTGSADRTIDLDYDRYANAEAELAWLNQSLTVESDRPFDPAAWARTVLGHVSVTATRKGWLVGHAKISLASDRGLTKLSLTADGAEPTVDAAVPADVSSADVRINARIACEPAELDSAVGEGVSRALVATATVATRHSTVPAFKPGYPRPTHRLASPLG